MAQQRTDSFKRYISRTFRRDERANLQRGYLRQILLSVSCFLCLLVSEMVLFVTLLVSKFCNSVIILYSLVLSVLQTLTYFCRVLLSKILGIVPSGVYQFTVQTFLTYAPDLRIRNALLAAINLPMTPRLLKFFSAKLMTSFDTNFLVLIFKRGSPVLVIVDSIKYCVQLPTYILYLVVNLFKFYGKLFRRTSKVLLQRTE